MTTSRTLPPRALHAALLLVLTGLAASSVAATASEDNERERIVSERSQIEARFAARERECRGRFIVTSCVDDAKRERRLGLDDLKARQLRLDEAKRRERTAERRAELAAKAGEDAKREQERAARAASASAPAARQDGLPASLEPRHEGAAPSGIPRIGVLRDHRGSGAAGAGPKSGQSETVDERQAREARSRAAFEERQREAAEHRQAVLDKAAQRIKQRRPAASLSVPGSAAAP
jgi:colicin import membrane protein